MGLRVITDEAVHFLHSESAVVRNLKVPQLVIFDILLLATHQVFQEVYCHGI